MSSQSQPVMRAVNLRCPKDVEIIAGHGFFSPLTIEDLFRAVAISVPRCQFGLAMAEGSSGLVRKTGNDSDLSELAAKYVLEVGAGHFFLILTRSAYPSQVVNAIKSLPSVVALYCATGNPVSLIVSDIGTGSAVLGVVDGGKATSVETTEDIRGRRSLLREIGYLEDEPSH